MARAVGSQSTGRGFDSHILHYLKKDNPSIRLSTRFFRDDGLYSYSNYLTIGKKKWPKRILKRYTWRFKPARNLISREGVKLGLPKQTGITRNAARKAKGWS